MTSFVSILLATAAFGALIYAFMGERIEALDPMRSRVLKIVPGGNETSTIVRVQETRRRIRADQRSRIQRDIDQSGLPWTQRKYQQIRIAAALGLAAVVFLLTQNVIATLAVAVVSIAAVPALFVNHVKRKRFKKFLDEFPVAIDIMVRSVQAGLPINAAVRTIIEELGDPLRSEFQRVVDRMGMGEPIASAIQVLTERLPLPEVNFFISTIGIQQKTGGSLAGTLENLAAVIRDRKDMHSKIKALSSEAKMSALILAAMPPFIIGGFTFMNPTYLKPLITTTTGNMAIGACLLWMVVGALIMRNMINFKV